MREGSLTRRNIFSKPSSPGPARAPSPVIPGPGPDSIPGRRAPSTSVRRRHSEPGDLSPSAEDGCDAGGSPPFPSRSRRNSSRTAEMPAQISSSVRAGAVPSSVCNSRSRLRMRSRLSIVRLIRRTLSISCFRACHSRICSRASRHSLSRSSFLAISAFAFSHSLPTISSRSFSSSSGDFDAKARATSAGDTPGLAATLAAGQSRA